MGSGTRSDASTPKREGYDYKKSFYRDTDVAADYDRHRFESRARQRRNAGKWRAIERALGAAGEIGPVLDLPCGTGRFTGRLAERGHRVIGSDISREMMIVARSKEPPHPNFAGHVQADAERLPLRTASVDCVISIRFMMHVDPPTRVRILREMSRVSRRWLVVDYRHRYSYRWVKWRLARTLGLTRRPFERVTTAQLHDEFRQAGLVVRRIFPVLRVFSDKWIVLSEPAGARD